MGGLPVVELVQVVTVLLMCVLLALLAGSVLAMAFLLGLLALVRKGARK